MATEDELPWGVVPPAVIALADVIVSKAVGSATHAGTIEWPTEPGDVQRPLRHAIRDAHGIAQAGNDLRALLSAYAHRFHDPRPVISDLARAQQASAQGFVRRYSDSTVDAIRSLLSAEPSVSVILAAFPSLSAQDLRQLGGAVGAAADEYLTAFYGDILEDAPTTSRYPGGGRPPLPKEDADGAEL